MYEHFNIFFKKRAQAKEKCAQKKWNEKYRKRSKPKEKKKRIKNKEKEKIKTDSTCNRETL